MTNILTDRAVDLEKDRLEREAAPIQREPAETTALSLEHPAAATPYRESTEATSPQQESEAATSPCQESVTAKSPQQESAAVTSPHQELMATASPCRESVAAKSPRQESAAATSPHQEPVVATLPHQEPVAAISHHGEPSADFTTYNAQSDSVDLIKQLRITIDVLVAEIECLKNEQKCDCHDRGWSKVVRKKKQPIHMVNRFLPLDTKPHESVKPIAELDPDHSEPENIERRRKKKKKLQKVQKDVSNKVPLPFSKINIHSDSHGRNLASLMGNLTDSTVSGMVKPSARLLDIIPPSDISALTDQHCAVLIAGTNDVASGRHDNIYRHLESFCKKNGRQKILLLTLPFRHDLPPHHPVNDEIAFANTYITELGDRHDHVQVLEFNLIPRPYFTRHGMHLKWRGKQLLARLIVECLAGCVQQPAVTETAPTTLTAATHPEPFTLPHETYAAAVLQTSPKTFPPSAQCLDGICLPETIQCSSEVKTKSFYNSSYVFLGKRGHFRARQVSAPPVTAQAP